MGNPKWGKVGGSPRHAHVRLSVRSMIEHDISGKSDDQENGVRWGDPQNKGELFNTNKKKKAGEAT